MSDSFTSAIEPMNSEDCRTLYATALNLAGDDRPAAKRLLELIIDTNRTTLGLLRAYVAAYDWEQIASAAHRCAGSARMLGCNELLVLLAQMETSARAQDSNSVAKFFPLVVRKLDALDISIQAAIRFAVI